MAWFAAIMISSSVVPYHNAQRLLILNSVYKNVGSYSVGGDDRSDCCGYRQSCVENLNHLTEHVPTYPVTFRQGTREWKYVEDGP